VQTQLAANQEAVSSQEDSRGQAAWQNFVNVPAQADAGTTYK